MASVKNHGFAPLCIWCSEPWSDSNVRLEAVDCGGCPTCGPEIEAKVRIICHKCNKVMYEKENSGYEWY